MLARSRASDRMCRRDRWPRSPGAAPRPRRPPSVSSGTLSRVRERAARPPEPGDPGRAGGRAAGVPAGRRAGRRSSQIACSVTVSRRTQALRQRAPAIGDGSTIAYIGEIPPGRLRGLDRDHQRRGHPPGQPDRYRRRGDAAHSGGAELARPLLRVAQHERPDLRAGRPHRRARGEGAGRRDAGAGRQAAVRGLRRKRVRQRARVRGQDGRGAPAITVASSAQGAQARSTPAPPPPGAAALFDQRRRRPARRVKLFAPSALDDDAFVSSLSAAAQRNLYVSSPGFTSGDLPRAGQAVRLGVPGRLRSRAGAPGDLRLRGDGRRARGAAQRGTRRPATAATIVHGVLRDQEPRPRRSGPTRSTRTATPASRRSSSAASGRGRSSRTRPCKSRGESPGAGCCLPVALAAVALVAGCGAGEPLGRPDPRHDAHDLLQRPAARRLERRGPGGAERRAAGARRRRATGSASTGSCSRRSTTRPHRAAAGTRARPRSTRGSRARTRPRSATSATSTPGASAISIPLLNRAGIAQISSGEHRRRADHCGHRAVARGAREVLPDRHADVRARGPERRGPGDGAGSRAADARVHSDVRARRRRGRRRGRRAHVRRSPRSPRRCASSASQAFLRHATDYRLAGRGRRRQSGADCVLISAIDESSAVLADHAARRRCRTR